MHRSSSQRLVVVVPGMQFGPHVPVLAYASRAAAVRAAQVLPLSWQPPKGRSSLDLAPWVVDQVNVVLDKLAAARPGAVPLLIGKSLGSHAAPVAVERGLPAIWLTPLLQHEPVVTALGRSNAPFMLVGGTGDPAWDGTVARRLTPHVVEVENADHGMWVPGPLTDSALVLGTIGRAVESFLDEVIWKVPAESRS
ncbi:alpha/beta hydrolase [Micromonospora sp. NPDC000663]|uniref:alpha/beta hydrolase n=1 Tax=Micromonospora sp. NPDC000663 TaxID=3364218 RepID=UPI0036AB534A